jgi:hypothetical protein
MFRENEPAIFIKMKELKNLTGAKMLSQNEQKSIKGGIPTIICDDNNPCPIGYLCLMGPYDGICVRH